MSIEFLRSTVIITFFLVHQENIFLLATYGNFIKVLDKEKGTPCHSYFDLNANISVCLNQ